MIEPAYPIATAIAGIIEAHFAHGHLTTGELRGELAPVPGAASIEAMIDTAFWASLHREEGHDPKISLAFIGPEQSGHAASFQTCLPLTTATLAKLAPAVERPGIHLGVWRFDGELKVWGIARVLPALCFVVEVVSPGLLVLKYRRDESFGKFGNVAVLEGDDVKMVDEDGEQTWDFPEPIRVLLDVDAPLPKDEAGTVLVQLAASMRAHNRGGALLIVPSNHEGWRSSIVWPANYLLEPPTRMLADFLDEEFEGRGGQTWQESLRRAIDAVAGLTAVDGATIVNDRYELLAFGAKIGRVANGRPIERLLYTESVVGHTPGVVHPNRIGGTRHLSAAQFVHDQQDALALVASQDGRFTVFAWSAQEGMVHAHRIETLLL